MSILIERQVAAPMRDGVVLRADVYHDPDRGPAPVLLLRTPYGKDGTEARGFSPIDAVERGYTFVIQDCRGTWSSEGEFTPFLQEIDDGYDTVEWCAAQPWANGRVGMLGVSYMGATPWLASIAAPPSLQAIYAALTGSDYHDGWIYQGGAFYLGFVFGWAVQFFGLAGLRRAGVDEATYRGREEEIFAGLMKLRKTCSETPLRDHRFFTELAPSPVLRDWLDTPPDDEFWRQVSIRANAGKITAPALSVGGWYDLFAAGPIQNFLAVREQGATEAARDGSRLVVGPWNHGASGGAQNIAGAVDFGWDARLDMQELAYSWFDHWLQDEELPASLVAPVRYFTMGSNEWRTAESWPPTEVSTVALHLHSEGHANSLSGDGALSPDAPGEEPSDTFRYDPLNPVPTVGGGGRFDGAFDHRRVEERDDVLVYSTPPFEQPFEIHGPLRLELSVASDAPEADFTAKLLEVSPEGFARNLSEGVVRSRYALPPGEARMRPGHVYQLELDLLNTSNRFEPGSRLRLEVSAGSYPRFDRNPQTGELAATATEFVAAQHSVHHSAAHPSRLWLRVSDAVRGAWPPLVRDFPSE